MDDALGRVTNVAQYDANGTNNYNKATTYDKDNRILQESGSDGTTNYYYAANGGELAQTSNVNSPRRAQ